MDKEKLKPPQLGFWCVTDAVENKSKDSVREVLATSEEFVYFSRFGRKAECTLVQWYQWARKHGAIKGR